VSYEGMFPLFLKPALWYGREGGSCSQLHAPAAVSLEKEYPHPLNRKLGVPLLGIEPWFLKYPFLQP